MLPSAQIAGVHTIALTPDRAPQLQDFFDGGAAWMRLGVVEGNVRAERFWIARGYVPVRDRHGIQMGNRIVTVRNMVKPVRGGALESYFALVPRDSPEARGEG